MFSAYGTGNLLPNSAKAGFGGFGLRLLVRQGFLDAKAARCSGLWLGAFGKAGLFRCQSRSFRPAFWLPCVIPTEPSGEWRNLILAFGKAGETSLLKMRQKSRERGAFASGNSCFTHSPVQKLQKAALFALFCKAEFLDSISVLAWREVGILNRENLCVTEFILLLPPSQDVSTH